MPPIFPGLPIITPDPPRKSQAVKYGGLYYIGITGLVVLIALVGWFALSAWALRGVWDDIYRLHDQRRSDAERIEAAHRLSREPSVSQRQRYDMVERNRGLPATARYLLAESLTAEAAEGDPRAYAMAVARSRGWPDWLRLLLLRPLAYGAGKDLGFPTEPLEELSRSTDPMIPLWAAYTRAVLGVAAAERSLEKVARGEDSRGMQARLLLAALRARGTERVALLDRATIRLRSDHPGAAEVWAGWTERAGRLTRQPAPKLQQPSPETASAGPTPRRPGPASGSESSGKERQR